MEMLQFLVDLVGLVGSEVSFDCARTLKTVNLVDLEDFLNLLLPDPEGLVDFRFRAIRIPFLTCTLTSARKSPLRTIQLNAFQDVKDSRYVFSEFLFVRKSDFDPCEVLCFQTLVGLYCVHTKT